MKIAMIVIGLFVAGCGYKQIDGELIGQVKKVIRVTPLLCPEYVSADISLGVLRGGVGSMSTQDVWVVVDKTHEKIFRNASENGKIVKVKYDVKRFGGNYVVCTPDHFATFIDYVDDIR